MDIREISSDFVPLFVSIDFIGQVSTNLSKDTIASFNVIIFTFCKQYRLQYVTCK